MNVYDDDMQGIRCFQCRALYDRFTAIEAASGDFGHDIVNPEYDDGRTTWVCSDECKDAAIATMEAA